MLLVISPAKSLNFENKSNANEFSKPEMLQDAERVMSVLRKKSVKKLMEMQSISKNLAELNYGRNQVWTRNSNLECAKQALSAFTGDVYIGINETDFTQENYSYAQANLRILSGLYGILKPLDLFQPYRLEMGTKLKTTRGINLYEFWKMRITDIVNYELSKQTEPVLVNLASDEYFKSIKTNKIAGRIVQPVFMDNSNGQYKILSFFAKKARGLMVRFAVKNELSNVEQLKAFDSEGYLFNSEMSSENRWVFTRNKE